ncbi:hypothetical protein [Pannonibacter indicus]|uniref:Uncharacterized protein n=1 Tax=Pannonibacter indicus TaxID=466044 RepID=A0A0K6HRU1_9HYPH|nr:hypothetical protein [Pannonibacter indicus]CUA93762.1 hypothetical protein Ga0061067_102505 [Pannonibacter indicus]
MAEIESYRGVPASALREEKTLSERRTERFEEFNARRSAMLAEAVNREADRKANRAEQLSDDADRIARRAVLGMGNRVDVTV